MGKNPEIATMYADLFFCKDIRPELGDIIRTIARNLSWIDWKYTTDDGFWKDKNIDVYAVDDNELKEIPPERRIDLEEYIQIISGDPDLESFLFCANQNKSEAWIKLPEPGGGRIVQRPNNMGYFIRRADINIRVQKNQETIQQHLDDIVNLFVELNPLIEPSYGYFESQSDSRSWEMTRHLMGASIITLFGPDYIEIMGREKFDRMDCEKVELEDGGMILIATRDTAKYVTGWRTPCNRIEKSIGREWFRPRSDRWWYPELRNLNKDRMNEKSKPLF
ncbi:hypothetical protein LLG95_04445 [bacterium]|nr:hypothetical protein [bacterium]